MMTTRKVLWALPALTAEAVGIAVIADAAAVVVAAAVAMTPAVSTVSARWVDLEGR